MLPSVKSWVRVQQLWCMPPTDTWAPLIPCSWCGMLKRRTSYRFDLSVAVLGSRLRNLLWIQMILSKIIVKHKAWLHFVPRRSPLSLMIETVKKSVHPPWVFFFLTSHMQRGVRSGGSKLHLQMQHLSQLHFPPSVILHLPSVSHLIHFHTLQVLIAWWVTHR